MQIDWIARHLDPGERLGEILFGLIMTLTFTLGAGIAIGETPDASRELLLATVGCNTAWGVIDGALLILGRLFDRGRLARLGQAIRHSASERDAITAVASELDETLEPITSSEMRESLYREILGRVRVATPRGSGLRGEDWIAALAVFGLVFFASLPAAVPFVFIEDPWLALRVSNLTLIGLLFIVGFKWAGYTHFNRWKAGIAMTVAGVLLVVMAIALGG